MSTDAKPNPLMSSLVFTLILLIRLFVVIFGGLTDINGVNTVIVDEDGFAILHCLHTTSQSAAVKWLKDGQPMVRSEAFVVHKNGSLVIKRAKLSDSGVYECQTDPNNSSSVITSKVANLSVRERLKFLSLPSNKNLELNSNSKLICKARGAPVLTVKWVKWSKEGQLSLDWPSHIQDLNGTLHLNPVKREDAGNYTCVATNAQGIINSSIEVVVTVKPKFTIQPKDISVIEGSSVSLHCRAEGDPIPSIQWDKNNVLNDLDPQRFTVLPNGTLTIDQAFIEDSGKYGCTAGNSGGFIRSEMSLNVNSYEYNSNQLGTNSEENSDKMKRTVAITLTAATLYMVLVMALMVYCRYRRAKRKASAAGVRSGLQNKSNDNLEMKERTNGTENAEQHRLLTSIDGKTKIVNKNSLRGEGDVHSQTSSTHSSKRSKSPFEKLQICKQDLQMICLLGNGEFGEVFLAKANKLTENGQIVLVKALHTKDENIVTDYKREIEMFSKLSHNRIVRLLGFCREADPLFVLEYSDWGDLKQFLLATRDDQSRKGGPKPTPLTLLQAIGIGHQIASAMEYLTNNRFVHKDLATRNCLITSKMDIKLTSTSLSRDTYSSDYHNYHNRDLPIRWAPHEAVIEDEWSAKSDVYSFGVTFWEIYFQAELPFGEMSDSMVIRSLESNQLLLEVPKDIPNSLKELLLNCWNTSPKDRPTFADVCHVLTKILHNINV